MGQLSKFSFRLACGLFLFFGLTVPVYSYMWHGLEVTPHATINETYNDNINLTKNDRISDAITNFLVGVGLKREGKTESALVNFDVSHYLFADHSDSDSTSENLDLTLKKEFSQYDLLNLTDSFSHSESPQSFEDEFGRTSGRYSTYENSFATFYRHDWTEQLGGTFHYSNSLTNHSRGDLVDSVLNSIGGGLNYTLGPSTILNFDYSFLRRDYNPGQSILENELAVGVRRFLTEQLYLDVQTGVDFFSPGTGKDRSKPLFRVKLTNDVNQTTQTLISFEKSYSMNSYNDDLFDMWRLSGRLGKQLTDRLYGSLSAFYGKGNYVSSNLQEKLAGLNIGGNWQLTKNTKLNFNYLISRNDSESSSSYTNNQVSLGMTFEF